MGKKYKTPFNAGSCPASVSGNIITPPPPPTTNNQKNTTPTHANPKWANQPKQKIPIQIQSHAVQSIHFSYQFYIHIIFIFHNNGSFVFAPVLPAFYQCKTVNFELTEF
jgi:hypothetical protein